MMFTLGRRPAMAVRALVARAIRAPRRAFATAVHGGDGTGGGASRREDDVDADAVGGVAAERVGDIVRVTCTDLATSGQGVCRLPSGMVLLCDGATPGEIIDARVVKVKKRVAEGVKRATVVDAPDATPPPCVYYDRCGGCSWQHITYDAQVAHKRRQVVDVLTRIGLEPEAEAKTSACASARATERYRNKMEFAFGRITEGRTARVVVGLRPRGSNEDVVEIGEHGCLLQSEEADAVLRRTRDALTRLGGSVEAFDRTTGEGTLRSMVIRSARDSHGTPSVMVDLATTAGDDELLFGPLADLLREISEMPHVVSVLHTSVPPEPELRRGNNRNSKFVKGGRGVKAKSNGSPTAVVKAMYGQNKLVETLDGVKFELSSASFFQTNTAQATQLVQIMRDACGFSGNNTEVVLDLFCGVGMMGLCVASRAKHVMGWEVVPEAVRDAKRNAEINGIENAKFYRVDLSSLNAKLGAKGLLANPKTGKELPMPDIVITDPARFGMAESLISILRTIGAKRIVYVSCNPATQARDMVLLTAQSQGPNDARYALVSCTPVDMFPHTSHVESVAVFDRV